MNKNAAHKREWPPAGLSPQRPHNWAYQPSYNVETDGFLKGGRELHLANQLLPVRSRESTLRFPGASIGSLQSLSKHAARCRDDKRNGGKERVGDQKSDEVRTRLRATEDVRFERHVHGPERRE